MDNPVSKSVVACFGAGCRRTARRELEGLAAKRRNAHQRYQDGQCRQELVHRFKFEGQYKLGQYLTEIALDILCERMYELKLDYVIPVPMIKTDKRKRGYNQTELIASVVSKKLGTPLESGLLRKIKKTEMQADLGARQRWENIKDAFAVEDNNILEGKSLLLVDDIVTTGATCRSLLARGSAH